MPWPLPARPAGSTPIPSRPFCLSPAGQPHKSASLSARSHTAVGTEPSVHLPKIHGGLWGAGGSSAQAIWPQSQRWARSRPACGRGQGPPRPEASGGWSPSPQRSRGSSKPQASPRGRAQGSAWGLPHLFYPRSYSAPPGMGREPPQFTPFGLSCHGHQPGFCGPIMCDGGGWQVQEGAHGPSCPSRDLCVLCVK